MSEHQLPATTTRESGGSTAEAIEGAAFLARSQHRVRVLGLLADGPHTREELLTGTDVTRVTLSRTLGDLADRRWIDRCHDDGRYAITDTGAAVYDDFRRLLETVTVGQRYPDVIDALPTDWFDFELRCLADSDVVATDGTDPLAGMRVVANAVGRATTVRAIVSSFTTLPMYAHAESLHAGDAPDATVVFDRGATDVSLKNPDLVDRWQMIEAATERPVYYSADQRFPCNVDLIDDETVFLSVSNGATGGFHVVRSTHPAVVDWARELVAEKRAESIPLARRQSETEPVGPHT
ncbi:helix-turn-helix transcriptional regulator [Natrinema gari]|uniref:Transcriptional regulator n=1 Tax=Natrinema gari JCM 14663 TaxID=1230459 RepID=L9Z7W2_9EURY|nr:transcriptional regulator [Natrinema gari]ELY81278.1 transcriptional regulator [Natrinema gari JCM 14663]